ncbi:MAG: sigma-54 dependent transcriptional regulator [Candidatus Binataceae bacterium]
MAELEETSPQDGTSAPEWLDLDTIAGEAAYVCGMVVRSAHMREVLRTISRLGPHKATVLIQGESGTGKELVAHALHVMGPAPKGPFVTFNCSNLVESLAESQLFGHVRGAFTDAREDSLGYFRSASGGTLFLDEIGDLPIQLQPKLLRAVETKEVQAVGSTRSHHVDVRLVAATNRDLRAMVRSGHFRDDLFYRLNATTITIAPLRQRRDAIPALAANLIEQCNRMLGTQIRFLSQRTLAALLAYEWPGNVRELAHAIESAVMLAERDRIDVGHLPEFVTAAAHAAGAALSSAEAEASGNEAREFAGEVAPIPTAPAIPAAAPFSRSLDEVIKRALVRSLEETGGDRRRAAEMLKISRSTLYRMLARYELPHLARHRPVVIDPVAAAPPTTASKLPTA